VVIAQKLPRLAPAKLFDRLYEERTTLLALQGGNFCTTENHSRVVIEDHQSPVAIKIAPRVVDLPQVIGVVALEALEVLLSSFVDPSCDRPEVQNPSDCCVTNGYEAL
jgi:hypothetical protein